MRPPTTLIPVALLAGIVLDAQEPPTFRVGSELVVVDLIVTDRTGRPIPDLDAGELQLLEDGRPQKIQFLRRLHSSDSGRPPGPAEPAAVGAPPTPSTVVGSAAARTSAGGGLVILIDLVRIAAHSQHVVVGR